MAKGTVRCRVLGHSDGPACDKCKKLMDSIRVEDKKNPLNGKKGHYCWPCHIKDKSNG